MPRLHHTLVAAIAIHAASARGVRTTSDGYDKALSPSLDASAKAAHAMIRRNLAEAADTMSAEDFSFKPTPGSAASPGSSPT